MNAAPAAHSPSLKNWQIRTFTLLWFGYAAYYICRMNFSIAQPRIMEDMGWTPEQIGMIPSVYSVFYAVGQFVNGQIGSKIGARLMMGLGLLGIAAVNLVFSFTSNYALMLVLWAANGYLQSTGWPLVVQTMSNWFSSGRRGTMMAFISTSYQVGNVLAWIIAGLLVDEVGWRAAFWIPTLALAPLGLLLLVGLRNQPEDAGLPHVRDDLGSAKPSDSAADTEEWTVWRIIKETLSNKLLWNLALSYFCFNAVRYAFMNWAATYFVKFHEMEIKGSAFLSIAFPLIGSLGAISSGWLSDRLFDSRRSPICTVFLFLLSGFCLLFIPVEAKDTLTATLILAAAGFVIYGADATLTGAAAVDLSHPKAAASAAGFIMAMGNLGAAIVAGVGVGLLLEEFGENNWTPVFITLSVLSLVATLLASLLWNHKPRK